MSTIRSPQAEPAPGSEADPFRYGWRYVTRKLPDGRVEQEQVPLTLEDLLFPEEGDFAVQFPSHVHDCFYLKLVLDAWFADDPEAVILTDCRVDWNLPGVRPLGPDIAVFLGVPRDFDRGTLGLAESGARPVLVVEVTSPETRKNDFGIKKNFYERANVPFYVIVDARPGPGGRRVKLHGFRHAPGGYDSMPLDDQGRLRLEPIGLWLAIVDGRVSCIDGRTGEPIGDYGEQVRARAEAEARAEWEARGRAEAEARAEEMFRNYQALERFANDQARTIETQIRITDKSIANAQALTRMNETQIRITDESIANAQALTRMNETQIRITDESIANSQALSRMNETQARLIEAEARARVQAEARALEAEARVREMEAENRRLRGEG